MRAFRLSFAVGFFIFLPFACEGLVSLSVAFEESVPDFSEADVDVELVRLRIGASSGEMDRYADSISGKYSDRSFSAILALAFSCALLAFSIFACLPPVGI